MENLSNIFFENGYFIIDQYKSILVPKINNLRNEITKIGESIDKNFDLSKSESIEKVNKNKFYRLIRTSLGLYNLAITKELLNICTNLKCKIPVLGPSYIRSDIIEENKHAFGWHQDSPCLLGSLNSVTFWIPLSDVDEVNGTIEIIEKSHTHGILKNKCRPGDDPMTSSSLIINENDAPKGNRKKIKLKKGELVAFHSLLVHRSYYPGNSHLPRVTAIIRYDDASDAKHRDSGFLTILDNKNINSAPQYKKILDKKIK